MTKRAAMTMAVLTLLVPVPETRAAGESPAGAAPSVQVAPTPGATRFVTRGGETIEGRIIDRLPNGYLVRLADETTRVVAYEDVAAVEGAPVPEAAPPPPPPLYAPPPGTVATGAPVARTRPEGESAERLGRAGQIILQQGFGFAQHTDTRTTLVLSPGIDFLVSNVLTLGFRAAVSHTASSTTTGTGGEGTSSSTSSSTDVSGALTLGVLFSPSRVVSLWPNIGGGIQHDFDGSGFTWVTSATEFALLLHPARHFFIALKPGVRGSRPLEGPNPEFSFAEVFNTGIGGWW